MCLFILVNEGGVFKLSNGYINATIDAYGRVTSLNVEGNSHNAVKTGEFQNQLCIFNNMPLYWDAWDVFDYHLESRTPLNNENVSYVG